MSGTPPIGGRVHPVRRLGVEISTSPRNWAVLVREGTRWARVPWKVLRSIAVKPGHAALTLDARRFEVDGEGQRGEVLVEVSTLDHHIPPHFLEPGSPSEGTTTALRNKKTAYRTAYQPSSVLR